jgi:hypothetical protein
MGSYQMAQSASKKWREGTCSQVLPTIFDIKGIAAK